MPHLRTYHIFISHAWRHSVSYDRLTLMLKKAQYLRWSNYSVPSYRALLTKTKYELTDSLYRQIRPTHVVIILAGMYVAHSYWIQKEIDIAEQLGKPMLGIYPWGSLKIPKAVQLAVDDMVGWNTASIVRAIRRLAI